jgi:hypothetical protein
MQVAAPERSFSMLLSASKRKEKCSNSGESEFDRTFEFSSAWQRVNFCLPHPDSALGKQRKPLSGASFLAFTSSATAIQNDEW